MRAPRRPFLALAAAAACACQGLTLGPACVAVRGGEDGARAQLRFVDVSDQRVFFVFGLRAEGRFGLPAYAIEPLAAAEGAAFVLRFAGAFTTNPDGSRSYEGPPVLAGSSVVRELRLGDESGDALRWELGLRVPSCPRVRDGLYAASTTFPRARVVLLLRGSSAIAIEPGTRYPGDPLTVSGLGFAPGAQVKLSISGREVHRTMADAAGDISSSFFAPELAPGTHLVAASDRSGHAADTNLVIAARP